MSPEARMELSCAALVLVVLTLLAASLSPYRSRLAAYWHESIVGDAHEGAR